jgi:signal recognition particle receptor subunit beta
VIPAVAPLKLLFAGPPGAGKTTAIAAISDFPPVNTDVTATDEVAELKEATTAAMDYGELTLAPDQKVFLYGTPGQVRFDFMWKILSTGSLGLIILIDNTSRDPLADLGLYVDHFRELIDRAAGVVGITRFQTGPALGEYFELLERKGCVMPILEVDARNRTDVLRLLDAFLSVLEYSGLPAGGRPA